MTQHFGEGAAAGLDRQRPLRTVIVGAGALGSLLAAYLTLADQDVTLIARGAQLETIRDRGLCLQTPSVGTPAEAPMTGGHPRGVSLPVAVKVATAGEYRDVPDVIIITVKEYNFDDIADDIARLAGQHTIVVPLLNAIGAGERLSTTLPASVHVIEGLAYVGAARPEPGVVRHSVDFFRVVLGPRARTRAPDGLPELAAMLRSAGLTVETSSDMLQSSLVKFVRVAALSGALLYVDGTAGDVASRPDALAFLAQLCDEIARVGEALGSPLGNAPGKAVLDMVHVIPADYRTSLKEDYDSGRPTEIKSQFLDVYDLGRAAGVAMPGHEQLLLLLGALPKDDDGVPGAG